nr:P-loop NTPase fold protein [Snodgrassella alvi]
MSDVKHKSWCKKIYGWWLKAKNKSKESKSSSEQNEKAEYEYQKLTPYTEVDLKESKRAFDYVFQHDDVRNIAISGAYGSGKSSLIESYKKYLQTTNTNRKLGRKFLHISLAHFRTENNYLSAVLNEEANSQNENNELSLLEAKILNQLIHQISAEQIPQSNFAVKRITSKRDLLAITVSSIIFLLFMLDIIFSATWKEFVLSLEYSGLKDLLLGLTTKIFLLSSAIWSMGLFAIFFYYIIKSQKYKNIFRKLKFQGNEIEIITESSDSFFDKYLNEVVYIFANADVDVIVFEDIDRFENEIIFERLREINTLANNQLKQYQKKKAKVLKFFYLLRDDIFCTKDRTKFFDFMIPVVPVIDGFNSYDKLTTILKIYIDGNKIENGFLEGVSLYIDDMRLLKNICNEFHLYYSNINNTELNANKMFAMMVYKNLFPLDFSLLQKNQGFVFYIFKNNAFTIHFLSIIENTKNKFLENIIKKDLELKNIENNYLESIEKIKDEYRRKRKDISNFPDLKKVNEKIEELDNQEQFEINGYQLEYERNKELINKEKENIQKKILQLTSSKSKDILKKKNIDQIFEYLSNSNNIEKNKTALEIKNSPYFSLLKYLIRNGYIDETYADYMAYFYPNSLTIADKTYLRSITDKNAKEYGYKLNNPKLVIERLQHHINYFSQPEIMNVDLVNYLLTYSENYTEELKAILYQFSMGENIKFFNVFWPALNKKNLQNFLNLLSEYSPNFFQIVLSSQLVSDYILKDLSLKILYCLPQEVIKKINEYDDNCLSNYIAYSSDYLNIADPDVEKLIEQFKFLDIKFIEINYETVNKDLFNKIYNNSLYKLNFANIKLILTTQYFAVDEQDIIHRNYTCVQGEPGSPLADYIARDINVYLHQILANCYHKITDNETEVLYLLNHNDISDAHKVEYIRYLQTPITNLDKVKSSKIRKIILHFGKSAE